MNDMKNLTDAIATGALDAASSILAEGLSKVEIDFVYGIKFKTPADYAAAREPLGTLIAMYAAEWGALVDAKCEDNTLRGPAEDGEEMRLLTLSYMRGYMTAVSHANQSGLADLLSVNSPTAQAH